VPNASVSEVALDRSGINALICQAMPAGMTQDFFWCHFWKGWHSNTLALDA
jgi:hypothetical protein